MRTCVKNIFAVYINWPLLHSWNVPKSQPKYRNYLSMLTLLFLDFNYETDIIMIIIIIIKLIAVTTKWIRITFS